MKMVERAFRHQAEPKHDLEREDASDLAPPQHPGKRTLNGELAESDPWMLARPNGPGRRSLVEAFVPPAAGRGDAVPMVQRKAIAGPAPAPDQARRIAAGAVKGGGGPLPFLDTLQRAFGRHDLRGVRAHVGDEAAAASRQIGAQAFAAGEHVVFGAAPDLYTAAHEAAHVVQQRAGLHLDGGVGQDDDAHERQADAVAEAVIAGRSVEELLGGEGAPMREGGAPQLQLRKIARGEILPIIVPGDEDELRDGNGYIATLQREMGLAVTCVHDEPTAAAIIAFQIDRKLVPTGKIDGETWQALLQANQESKGSPVRKKGKEGALVIRGEDRATLRARHQTVQRLSSALSEEARTAMSELLATFDDRGQQRFYRALMTLPVGTLARAFSVIQQSPQSLRPVLQGSIRQVVQPLMLLAPPEPEAAPADPQIAAHGPGGVEHIRNSCYAASILTLLASVPQYVQLFDPQHNVLHPDSSGHTIQAAMSPLIVAVRDGQKVSGDQMATLITTLNQLGLLARQDNDPEGVPTTALPHDAGEVLIHLLGELITPQNRATYATQERTERAYADGEKFDPDDRHHNVMSLDAENGETFEDALRARFADASSPGGADRRYTDSRRAVSFPEVLTIYVSHGGDDHHRVDAPQEFTVPHELTPDGRPGPRYRLQSFILRNNYARRGGHFVAYASNAQGQWFEADDMGGGLAKQPGPEPKTEPKTDSSSGPKTEPKTESGSGSKTEPKPQTTPPPAQAQSKSARKRQGRKKNRQPAQTQQTTAQPSTPPGKSEPGKSEPPSSEPSASSPGKESGKPGIDKPASVPSVADAPADPQVEARPAVRPVDLSTARYQGAEDPAFSMGCVYTYLLVRDDQEDDPRVSFADLNAFPVYNAEAHEHDLNYLNVVAMLRRVESSLATSGMEGYAEQLADIRTKLSSMSFETVEASGELEVLHARLESLYDLARSQYRKDNPLPEPTKEPPIPPERVDFEIPIDRLEQLPKQPELTESVHDWITKVTRFNQDLRSPTLDIQILLSRFRKLVGKLSTSDLFAELPAWVQKIDDRDARLDALTALYQFLVTDLRSILRRFADWGRKVRPSSDKGAAPWRVPQPGNRPELHSQVVEELGPAAASKNSQMKVPIPFPDYDGTNLKHTAPLAPRDQQKLVTLSRDGGVFGKQATPGKPDPRYKPDAPNDKSVREGITGMSAARQHPGQFSNIVRGPKNIEFFDNQGLPWDVKTPPSRTRDKGMTVGTSKSISDQLGESFQTYNHEDQALNATKAPVSVMLDVTYLEDWDWIQLWLDLAECLTADQLVRVHEIVSDVPERRTMTGSKAGAEADKDVTTKPGQGKPAKTRPAKQTGKRGKQPAKPTTAAPTKPTPEAAPKISIEKIYPNVMLLERNKTGGLAAAGSSGLPIPYIRERCLAAEDVLRAVTDARLAESKGTYSNHRGYIPGGGVLIEYWCSATLFSDKSKARLVWNPRSRELYATGTHYETWYETWPDYAWRNGFYRVELSPTTIAAIDEAWGPARDKDDGKALMDPASGKDGGPDKGGPSSGGPAKDSSGKGGPAKGSSNSGPSKDGPSKDSTPRDSTPKGGPGNSNPRRGKSRK